MTNASRGDASPGPDDEREPERLEGDVHGGGGGGNGHAPPPPAALRLRLELAIPSDVRYIEPIVGVVQRECAVFDYPTRHCTLNVPVALSEALSNAILRGNRERPHTEVRVRACMDQEALVVEIEDEGTGFDLEASTNDLTDPRNLEREDGRGLFLMRALMDRVERFQAGGNVVRLTLRRS